jgi:hypothetical protein
VQRRINWRPQPGLQPTITSILYCSYSPALLTHSTLVALTPEANLFVQFMACSCPLDADAAVVEKDSGVGCVGVCQSAVPPGII